MSVRVFSESGKQVGKTHPDCEQHQLRNMEKQAYKLILGKDFTCSFLMPAMDNFSKSYELSDSHTYKEDSFLILFIL